MKAKTTRTLNRLPFEDLEPHRFEDLVRQLAYDFRPWKYLEATGRGGSDDGLDIRATELILAEEAGSADVDDEFQAGPVVIGERLWVFQCKRERNLAPKRLRNVIEESLVSLATPPYGFVLAVACDVSKKARDAFREEMLARGVEEFVLWARAELEDMLFQSKNDRLLFAYFGISLQPRRRSLSTSLRSQIAKKKQLTALLGDENHDGKLVLLRDPTDERYPRPPKEGEAPARWVACRAISLKYPGQLLVLRHEYLAALAPDGKRWDAILEHDVAETFVENELRVMNAWSLEQQDSSVRTPHDFWNEYIPDADRAILKVYRAVSLDRILAIDPLGDGYFPVPHIMVDFDDGMSPFTAGEFVALKPVRAQGAHVDLTPEESNRAQIFPRPLPDAHEPPPAGFDHTTSDILPLSDAADGTLSALLASMAESRDSTAKEAQAVNVRIEQMHAKRQSFQEWRQSVAIPLFSSFVARLRAEGHSARVVVRSANAVPNYHGAVDSVELRVKLHVGSPYNLGYRPSGHIRVSMSEYTGWNMELWPKREVSTNGRYSSPSRPTIEAMRKEQLESEVLGVIERLHARG